MKKIIITLQLIIIIVLVVELLLCQKKEVEQKDYHCIQRDFMKVSKDGIKEMFRDKEITCPEDLTNLTPKGE